MWYALAVIAAVIAFVWIGFNKLRVADIGAQEALGGINVQLTRRADLIPNLVEAVKGYAQHEKSTFEEVTRARARLQSAVAGSDVAEKAAADAQLQQAMINLNAVAEAYPELKASANFMDLQAQLTDTENQLAFSRSYYNDATTTLNTLVKTIPWMFLVGLAGVKEREFYKAPQGQDVPPKVDFGTGAPAAPPAAPAPTTEPPAATGEATP